MVLETPFEATPLPNMSHWIAGRRLEVLPASTGPIHNPATGRVIARVPRGEASEIDAAVAVAGANAAFPAWRDLPLTHAGTFDEAMRMVNGHKYANGTAMVTERWPGPGKTGPLSLVFPGNS
jgi:malonate-semialdehyde dehydrogenase (acetylating) / methylmalonate-semialdehyde dehydrogenase